MGKGKLGDAGQAVASPAPGASNSGSIRGALRPCAAAVTDAVAARCVVLLLFGIAVFVSVVFLLFPLQPCASEHRLAGKIQASFFLQKPVHLLRSHKEMLEDDIFKEIGVQNSKVSVTLKQVGSDHSTYVTFAVLPHPENALISSKSLNKLRSALVELTLEQTNLSLTPSVFGDPFCLELLGFPGGITVVPAQPDRRDLFDPREALFYFTLHISIYQILEVLDYMKVLLKILLQLRPSENLYLRLRNANGSTVAPPVTVYVLVFSGVGDYDLQPYRRKQLAEFILDSFPRNLGLSHSMFGTVTDLKLPPIHKCITQTPSAPSAAPAPSVYLYVPPSPQPSPAPGPSVSSHVPPSPQPPIPRRHERRHCPILPTARNETIPRHRELFRLFSKFVPPKLPERSRSSRASGKNRSSTALPSPMPA